MKETEITALERSNKDQKSKIIALSGFVSSSDNSVKKGILLELPKKLRALASSTDEDQLNGYKKVLTSQAKLRSLDEVIKKEAFLLLTNRYFITLWIC